MLFHPKRDDRLGRLEDRLRQARAVTPDLLNEVIARGCVRCSQHRSSAKVRIEHLIGAGAFTEAAFALIDVELPRWTLRRLVHDDGEWFCSLSGQSGLPAELDDVAEGHHEVLPLAVLMALIQALDAAADDTRTASVPQVRQASGQVACCDNFT